MKKLLMQLMALIFSVWSTLALAADEVQLWAVTSAIQTRGFSIQTVKFEVLVANLAFEKKVAVHLRRWDGVWVDVPLTFNRIINKDYELWSGSFEANTSHLDEKTFDPRFAIRYEVAGQTYWDNNHGYDYSFDKDFGSWLIGGVNVYNVDYSPTQDTGQSTTDYFGSVVLRNIAFAKNVRIHYSTDNWKTVKFADARFGGDRWYSGYNSAKNPNRYGFERWIFSLDIGAADKVVYAIAYTVAGQTYWDNNFGHDYTVKMIRH